MTTALQRTVLVVGPRSDEPSLLYPEDVNGSMTLVVIAVGWPLTATQRATVEACRELAREAGIVFDASLVGSFDEGLEAVSTRDRVLLGTDGRETRRCNRILRGRRITARAAR